MLCKILFFFGYYIVIWWLVLKEDFSRDYLKYFIGENMVRTPYIMLDPGARAKKVLPVGSTWGNFFLIVT